MLSAGRRLPLAVPYFRSLADFILAKRICNCYKHVGPERDDFERRIARHTLQTQRTVGDVLNLTRPHIRLTSTSHRSTSGFDINSDVTTSGINS